MTRIEYNNRRQEFIRDIIHIIDEYGFNFNRQKEKPKTYSFDRDGWNYEIQSWRYNTKEDLELHVYRCMDDASFCIVERAFIYDKNYRRRLEKYDMIYEDYFINYFRSDIIHWKCQFCSTKLKSKSSLLNHLRSSRHTKQKNEQLLSLLPKMPDEIVSYIGSFL